MRDVQTDERAAFAFDMAQASTQQLLQWVYPPLYPVHDPATPWGRPDEQGRCGRSFKTAPLPWLHAQLDALRCYI